MTGKKRSSVRSTLYDKILSMQMKKQMSTDQKIILALDGTVETTLRIITDSEIVVRVTQQTENKRSIQRESLLVNKRTDRPLLHAHTTVFPRSLPETIIHQIREKKKGIGTIISGIETRRKIYEIGWTSDYKCPYKRYGIFHNNELAFKIKEEILI